MEMLVVFGVLGIVLVWWIGLAMVFAKAGHPGWAVFAPIYNLMVLAQIACMSIWWVLALMIPGLNFLAFIPVSLAIARRFGKSTAFGIGMALLPFVFYPILGFGSAEYADDPVAAAEAGW